MAQRDDRRRREAVVLLDERLHAIGGQNFQRGALGGAERACVSLPMNSGPSVPWAWRYSQIACVIARMWASVNVPSRDVPRWPLVPKLTSWPGSPTSGLRS